MTHQIDAVEALRGYTDLVYMYRYLTPINRQPLACILLAFSLMRGKCLLFKLLGVVRVNIYHRAFANIFSIIDWNRCIIILIICQTVGSARFNNYNLHQRCRFYS